MYITPAALLSSVLTHTPFMMYERGGVALKWWANDVFYPLFMRTAYRVVAQTENQKQMLLKYGKREVEVVPNGVDTSRFGLLSKSEARQKLGFWQDKPIVLCVSRCRPEKNLAQFVKAASLGTKDAIYVLAGDGEQLDMLKMMADAYRLHNFVFAGLLPNQEIPTYMAAADLLVNTSLSEGFPVTVLEAMAAGLPIIAPRVCGLPEVIKEENGVLIRVDDASATALTIDRLLEAVELRNAMSRANLEKAKQYTWQNVVRRLYGTP